MFRTLTLHDLRPGVDETTLDSTTLEATTEGRTGKPGALGQDRALSALALGLGIRQRGYNIFVVGASGTGRTSTVRTVLDAHAAREPTAEDVVLLYNFADRDRPLAVFVPTAQGPVVKRAYEALVEEVLRDLEKAFESDTYLAKRQEIESESQGRADEFLSTIESEAREKGFILSRAGGALTLSVADADGNALTEEAFEALTSERKEELERNAEGLQTGLEDALRRIRTVEKESDIALEELGRATADDVVRPILESVKEKLAAMERVVEHLSAVHDDILNRVHRLVPDDGAEEGGPEGAAARASSHHHRLLEEENDTDRDEPALLRYRVNVLVTHDPHDGAPVVAETHPTASNLLGRIVHKTRGGETSTDFTQIKAGALFRANGGYLIVHAQDLLRDPTAWEGLKRALKNKEIELDDPGEPGRMVTIASLRPEPLPLAIKVCLIGTPDLYYALSRGDPDFAKLFKVKVDFDLEMDRTTTNLAKYLDFVVGVAHEEKLRPLSRSGAARILEHAVRVSHHAEKLTTRFGWIADLLREANFYAEQEGATHIAREHIRRALDARADREGFIELRMRDDVREGRVRIETQGSVVGQANGLTVLDLGSYQFGMPARITCRVGAGKGEIIDIERETDLGGPIHTKGTLILRGILLDRFGSETALKLSATVCIEQSYSDIDGDSASLAEACALFSALAEAPIRQDLAITGSIDQRGQAQAVGGVNEKIEGFFRVARLRPNDGPHTVVIPAANAKDLMLDEDVIEGCKAGKFSVITVETLEDALEVMTGRKWDKGKDNLKAAVIARLQELAKLQDRARPSVTRLPTKKPVTRAAAKSRKPRGR
jgi:lon-related putative ATP-dependent protease